MKLKKIIRILLCNNLDFFFIYNKLEKKIIKVKKFEGFSEAISKKIR